MKMTIAQMREKELHRLAAYKNAEPSGEDIAEARKIMNSYYRLCGLCERNLNLANDARWHDKPYTKQSEAREQKWFERLDKQFNELYGLRLNYCGYMPSIGTLDENHCFCDKISTFFYE